MDIWRGWRERKKKKQWGRKDLAKLVLSRAEAKARAIGSQSHLWGCSIITNCIGQGKGRLHMYNVHVIIIFFYSGIDRTIVRRCHVTEIVMYQISEFVDLVTILLKCMYVDKNAHLETPINTDVQWWDNHTWEQYNVSLIATWDFLG